MANVKIEKLPSAGVASLVITDLVEPDSVAVAVEILESVAESVTPLINAYKAKSDGYGDLEWPILRVALAFELEANSYFARAAEQAENALGVLNLKLDPKETKYAEIYQLALDNP